ncbi:MAG: D-alanyl-D-alanine carboxypeptidase family protein [Lachnospiraceae bacterium]
MAKRNNSPRYGGDPEEDNDLSIGFLDVPEEAQEPEENPDEGDAPRQDWEESDLDDPDFPEDLDDLGDLDDGADREYLAELRRNRANRSRQEKRARRQKERRKEVLMARSILAVVLAGCAVLAVGLIFLVRSHLGAFTGSASETTAQAASSESTGSTAIGGAAIGTPEYEGTAGATESAEDGSTMPTEAMIEVARTAKNYSADVATFWPYDWFYEDDNTKLIPCDAAAAAEAAASDSTTSSEEASSEADSSDTASSEAVSTEEAALEDTSSEEASTEASTAASGADPYIIGDGDHTFTSQYGILVNVDTGEIVAEKSPKERIVPASMTKVMSLLVAVDQMQDPDTQLKDVVTLTQADEEFAYVNESSAVCWMPGDTATVEDLLYGMILPSGADAAVALAEYTAGSQDAFVELMNEKAKELGLTDTHFTNCVGCYDEDHYSTVYDIAVIMKAAVENDLCRKVLSTHTWTTSPTSEHPEGITVSNWFLRRIEDSDNHGTVLCAKTGYVEQSGFCAVSYQIANDGSHYILCSADTYSSWQAIYDHTAMYQEYTN